MSLKESLNAEGRGFSFLHLNNLKILSDHAVSGVMLFTVIGKKKLYIQIDEN